jgi:hypothetical protein
LAPTETAPPKRKTRISIDEELEVEPELERYKNRSQCQEIKVSIPFFILHYTGQMAKVVIT